MKQQSAQLLINTRSRQGRQSLHTIQDACKQHGIELHTIHKLTKNDNIAKLCSTIKRQKPSLLLIAGGDGTVSSALHHLARVPIELGIVPLGTTNNFARSLNIPFDIDEAVKTIATYKAKPVDLGNADGHSFADVVGVGLSARIAKNVNDKTKKRWGRFAYAAAGFKELLSHSSFMVTISDPAGQLVFNLETRQLIIANGRYHAGKKIAQDAAIDNRELIIFALGNRSRLSFIKHTFDFYVGGRKSIAHSSYVTGKHFIVTTNRPQPVEVDGEPLLKTPLEVQVQPKAVYIRYAA